MHLALHRTAAAPAMPGDDHTPGSVTVGFDLPDLAAAVARLREAGWPVSDPEVLQGMDRPSSRVAGPEHMHVQLVQG